MGLLESIYSVDIYRVVHLAAVFCLSVVLAKAILLYQRCTEISKALKAFPGPPSHWLYGQANEFHQDGQDLDRLLNWGLQYPYANPVWFGKFVVYMNITHPEYAKALLSRTDPKDTITYHHLISWIGKGLSVLSGQIWDKHRKLLTSSFHFDVLNLYVNQMAESTKIMLGKLEEQITSSDTIDIYPYVTLMTLDTIIKCTLGWNSNCQIDSPSGFLFRKVYKTSQQHTANIIKQRRETLLREDKLDKDQQSRHLDFLEMLLASQDENGQGLSDEDIRAELDTIIFEGHNTTASGISWILYCMAKYPEHQHKCRKEIREVLRERDTLQWNDLTLFPYTTMCVKESLRLYSPMPILTRRLSKPISFSDGRSLPEGCLVSMCIDSIHRNPEVWEDPEVFDPLRFSHENSVLLHSHAYLPFAAGPRNCIGQKFAMNEMTVAIALTLNAFELSLDPSQLPIKEALLVLKSKNGIHLRIQKQTQNK
ncbi:cytochrome P450 4B1-like isoform X2 [Xenopus laevis]|uniref:Cytochrome P450 4B1-like isoform X2 n=1 Tax=Xenopus laevis TaxID=8355 RepID=A0A8J1MX78_XENLA|nr:cytochrome P450 4B1-like isoform X2 [Xenopus laevis]